MQEFLVINGRQVHDIVHSDYEKIINIVEDTYCAHYKGNTINPNTYSLKFPQKPNARINALPAYVGENINLAGMKWISSFPDNVKYGIPRASAIVVLNDFNTGYPLACLEGSIISAARTAASAVIGAYVLKGKQTKTIAFIGCGLISRYIFDFFIGSGWDFEQINLYDHNQDFSEKFAHYIHKKTTTKVNINKSFAAACAKSEMVILATTASEPYIFDKDVFFINALIINMSLRDISPDIINDNINIVDDINHCLNSLTSMHLAYLKYNSHNFIKATIGELLVNKIPLYQENQLTIYSPFGMGILDIAVGSFIYNSIRQSNSKTAIPDFFYENTRW